MSHELSVITNPRELRNEITELREGAETEVLLAKLGGDALKFAKATFSDAVSNGEVMAQKFDREPEGRGAHFDIYNERLSGTYPWIALYNLSGSNTLTAATLPNHLADQYFSQYPEPNEEAKVARRVFSRMALLSGDVETSTGELNSGMGLVLPQRKDGPHVIHNIVPNVPAHPGSFIKMVVPAAEKDAQDLAEVGYSELEQLLDAMKPVKPSRKVPKLSNRALHSVRELFSRTPQTSSNAKRPCNYD